MSQQRWAKEERLLLLTSQIRMAFGEPPTLPTPAVGKNNPSQKELATDLVQVVTLAAVACKQILIPYGIIGHVSLHHWSVCDDSLETPGVLTSLDPLKALKVVTGLY